MAGAGAGAGAGAATARRGRKGVSVDSENFMAFRAMGEGATDRYEVSRIKIS